MEIFCAETCQANSKLQAHHQSTPNCEHARMLLRKSLVMACGEEKLSPSATAVQQRSPFAVYLVQHVIHLPFLYLYIYNIVFIYLFIFIYVSMLSVHEY